MLSTLTANASHFARDGSGGNEGGGSYSDQVQAQRSLKSAANVLTSGQKDAELDLLTPYAALPRHISGPTVWDAADYRGEENRGRWVHTWTAEEVQQLEDASVLWRDSGRELGEIERSTFPLPLSLVTTLLQLRERLVHGVGFYLFKGLPTQRWGTHLSAIAYLGLGSYLGNVNSQNGKGHVLGHVKDLGNDPTQIDKVRIYSTNARQFFHTDSSGGLVGLLCLHKALEGGESDIASSHLLWNELQRTRPDVAETLATPNWYYDRKGEVSEGEKGWVQKPVFWLAKGAPAHQLSCQWDPYYIRSIGRHVDAGHIPAVTPAQEEAMRVLEETAHKIALHMILDVGDIQFVSDHHVLHARTAYRDHAPPAPRRHLLRLWLATPEGPDPLNQGWTSGWKTVYADSTHERRGGIQAWIIVHPRCRSQCSHFHSPLHAPTTARDGPELIKGLRLDTLLRGPILPTSAFVYAHRPSPALPPAPPSATASATASPTMVKMHRVEDRPTPPQIYNWKIFGLACIAAWAAVAIGYDSAFVGTSITLAGFTNDFGKLASNTSSNLVSTYQAGAFFGSFMGYPIGHFIGRRWGLTLVATLFTIGAVIMTVASPATGLAPIYAGRAIAGLAIGAASNLTPMYIAEIAPPAIRGQLVGLYEIGWQIGGIVGFFIAYGVSTTIAPSTLQWRIPFGVQIIPGGLFMLMAPLLIESPRWLLSRGRTEQAAVALSKIRTLDRNEPYLVEELHDMDVALAEQREACGGDGFWAPFRVVFTDRKMLWRLFLTSSLFAFQNGTGINAINYYSPTVFKSLGITGANTGLLTTGIFGVIKTLGAFVWIFFLIDRLGRRKIFMWGAAGGSVAMLAIAIYIAVDKPEERPMGSGIDATGRFALACFYLWTVAYGVSWNGTPWVVASEIFPLHARAIGQTCGASSNWLWNFVIAKCTPLAFDNIGWGFYLIFSVLMLISIPYVFFVLPETKGIPLEKMDELFARRPIRKAGPSLMAELQEQSHSYDPNVARLARSASNSGDITPEKDSRGSLELNNATA